MHPSSNLAFRFRTGFHITFSEAFPVPADIKAMHMANKHLPTKQNPAVPAFMQLIQDKFDQVKDTSGNRTVLEEGPWGHADPGSSLGRHPGPSMYDLHPAMYQSLCITYNRL